MTNDIRDAFRTMINALTPIWYGTSDVLTPGKVLFSEHSTPPFVIVHPDDVSRLPAGARHLRDYRPTQADTVKMMEAWREERLKQPIAYESNEPEGDRYALRIRWGVR